MSWDDRFQQNADERWEAEMKQKKEEEEKRLIISQLSDDELTKELKRREEDRARKALEDLKAAQARASLRAEQVISILTKDPSNVSMFINDVAPKHDKMDCSDAHPNNSFWSSSNDVPKCVRCGLLVMLRDKSVPIGVGIGIRFYEVFSDEP